MQDGTDKSGQIFHTGQSTDGGYFMCSACHNADNVVSPATHKRLPICSCGSHEWIWVMAYDDSAR